MFHHTGFIRDFSARVSHVRFYVQDKINLARRAIYIFGRPLKGTMVEAILKGESLVLTLVRFLFFFWYSSNADLMMLHRILFMSDCHP